MDHISILKRAFSNTWNYRVLWIFGVLVALTSSSGGGSGPGGGAPPVPGSSMGSMGSGAPESTQISQVIGQVSGILIGLGIAMACLAVIVMVVAVVLRYVGRTALIGLVDDYEQSGDKKTVGEGFRVGWSRSAFWLFLIDLLLGIPMAILVIGLVLVAATPLLLWFTKNTIAGIAGTMIFMATLLLVILILSIVGIVITLLTHFFRRACVIENLGVLESIGEGFCLVKRNWKDVIIMWLLMVGVGIVWAMVMIPVMLAALFLAVALAGMPAFMIGAFSYLVTQEPIAWLSSAVVGIPVFMLVMLIVGVGLSTLLIVFKSNVWTLTYRTLRARESANLEQAPPALEASAVENGASA